jgi:hypothetical protein
VVTAVEINDWICVYPSDRGGDVEKFVHRLAEAGRKVGVRLGHPITVPLSDDRAESIYSSLKKSLNKSVSIK